MAGAALNGRHDIIGHKDMQRQGADHTAAGQMTDRRAEMQKP